MGICLVGRLTVHPLPSPTVITFDERYELHRWSFGYEPCRHQNRIASLRGFFQLHTIVSWRDLHFLENRCLFYRVAWELSFAIWLCYGHEQWILDVPSVPGDQCPTIISPRDYPCKGHESHLGFIGRFINNPHIAMHFKLSTFVALLAATAPCLPTTPL